MALSEARLETGRALVSLCQGSQPDGVICILLRVWEGKVGDGAVVGRSVWV